MHIELKPIDFVKVSGLEKKRVLSLVLAEIITVPGACRTPSGTAPKPISCLAILSERKGSWGTLQDKNTRSIPAQLFDCSHREVNNRQLRECCFFFFFFFFIFSRLRKMHGFASIL